jgi:hypothetical protein
VIFHNEPTTSLLINCERLTHLYTYTPLVTLENKSPKWSPIMYVHKYSWHIEHAKILSPIQVLTIELTALDTLILWCQWCNIYRNKITNAFTCISSFNIYFLCIVKNELISWCMQVKSSQTTPTCCVSIVIFIPLQYSPLLFSEFFFSNFRFIKDRISDNT